VLCSDYSSLLVAVQQVTAVQHQSLVHRSEMQRAPTLWPTQKSLIYPVHFCLKMTTVNIYITAYTQ
jgi:hypothetical protein